MLQPKVWNWISGSAHNFLFIYFFSFDSPDVDTLYRVLSVGDESSTEYDQNLIYGLKV